jgi:hypothetical protein
VPLAEASLSFGGEKAPEVYVLPRPSVFNLETWEYGAEAGFLVPMNLKVYDEFRKEDRNDLPVIDRNMHIAHPVFNRRWVHVIFVMGPPLAFPYFRVLFGS